MKILITGGNSYIAKSLKNNLSNVTLITRKDLDLTNKESVDTWFIDKYFDIVIHTAIRGGRRLIKDNAQVTHDNLLMFLNLLKDNMT